MNHQFDELTKGLAQSVTRRTALKQFGLGIGCVGLACLTLATAARATEPTFTTIDYPGSVFTLAAGINSHGVIVGRYMDEAGLHHGFVLNNGVFTSMDIPEADLTRPVGINVHGDIVGHYNLLGQNKDHGFLLRDGALTVIDFPGAEETVAGGINRHGEIAGYYRDAKKKWHGFVLRGGVFTTIDYPGAKYSQAWRINDSGQIVGRYADPDGTFHLYRFSDGQFESLNFPGAIETAPSGYSHLGGLNNLGDIVSDYASGTPYENLSNPNTYGNVHGGLLLSGGAFISIDPPGAVQTVAIDVNDGGQVVGVFADATGTHGFIRSP